MLKGLLLKLGRASCIPHLISLLTESYIRLFIGSPVNPVAVSILSQDTEI